MRRFPWKKCLLSLILIVALVYIGLRFSNLRIEKPNGLPSSNPKFPIDVVAYNAHLLPWTANLAVGKRSDSAYRASAIGEELRKFDLIGISEALSERHAARLIDAFNFGPEKPFSFVRSPSPKSPTQFSSGGLILFSRLPIVDSNTMNFSRGSRWIPSGFQSADGLAAKGVVHARVQLSTEPVIHCDCFLTHLESQSEPIRMLQIEELVEFASTHYQSDNMIIILGDFNVIGPKELPANPENIPTEFPAYASLLHQLRTISPKLKDVSMPLDKKLSGTSDAMARDGGNRIDYIFAASPDNANVQYTFQPSEMTLRDSNVAEGSLSDHAAVACRIHEQ